MLLKESNLDTPYLEKLPNVAIGTISTFGENYGLLAIQVAKCHPRNRTLIPLKEIVPT